MTSPLRLGLLGPVPWRHTARIHAAWERQATWLAAGLERAGVEVVRLAPPAEDRVRRDNGARDAALLARLCACASELDVLLNLAETLPFAAGPLLDLPIATVLVGRPSTSHLAVYRSASATSIFVPAVTAAASKDLRTTAVLTGGVPADAYAAPARRGDAILRLGTETSQRSQRAAREAAGRLGLPLVELDTDEPTERAARIAGCRAAIQLDGFDEPFGLSVLEALAAGVPVVALRRGVARTVIEDGRTGFLVRDADDAVAALSRVDELDPRACRAAAAEQFSIERMAAEVHRIAAELSAAAGRRRVDESHDRRPWGEYRVLESAETFKVKRIDVLPGQRLSYQRHERRSEHWMVVGGIARVTLDGVLHDLQPGDTVDIPAGTAHRIENPGTEPMAFIEVQTGSYFGEDDIVRLEDDYGRHPAE